MLTGMGSNFAEGTTGGAQAPTHDPRWQAAERVAASSVFRKTPKLREFLLYICERVVAGKIEDIKEQQIGHAVFGRPLGFDSSLDNIVRSSARQLRLKLDDYFSGEGASDPMRIEIPKGSYVPVFHEVPQGVVEAAVPAGAGGSRRWWWLAAVAGASLVFAAFWYAAARPRPAPLESSALWKRFIGDGSLPVRILTSDGSFRMIQEGYPRPITLTEYMGAKFPWALPGISEERLKIAHNGMTDLSDVLIAAALARLAPRGMTVEVHQPRQLPALSLPRSNVVVIGGPRANPWTQLFRNERAFALRQLGALCFDVVKRDAAPQAEYCHGSGIGYGAVALLPNPHGEGLTLLLEGTTPPLTVAASRFLTDPALFDRIAGRMGREPYFDLLFRSEVVRAAAGEIELIAVKPFKDPREGR